MVSAAQPLPADLDPRLLTEAFRRARERSANAEIDSESLWFAIVEQARRGARDIYTLVKAASAAGEARRNLAA